MRARVVLWQLLTKTVNNKLSNLISKNLIRIIRELNKKSLIYFYTIYTTGTWSMLAINSPTLMSIY